MNRHPAPAVLATFLRGDLPRPEVRAVLRHLLRGCAECAGKLAPAFGSSTSLSPPVAEARYDFPIGRAFASLRREAGALAEARRAAAGTLRAGRGREGAGVAGPSARAGAPPRPDLVRRSSFERFLAESRSRQRSDPEEGLFFASLAWAEVDAIDPASADPMHLADLRARALGELGNAYRVANDPQRAERFLSAALNCAHQGTHVDPLLFARLMDLAASTCADLRRFAEAFQLLDGAYFLYRASGDPHRAGRVLITKGLHLGYAGRPDEGIAVLRQGLEAIDLRADPDLTLLALHNWLLLLVDAGRYVEARRRLSGLRECFAAFAGEIDLTKLRGIEARIDAGLGELERAEHAFLEVWADLQDRRMPYTAAIVALDLAELWLRQGRTGEVLDLVEGTLATFRALDIRREATAAFLVLRRAVDQGRATGRLLKTVAGRLRRLERRFGPAGLGDEAQVG